MFINQKQCYQAGIVKFFAILCIVLFVIQGTLFSAFAIGKEQVREISDTAINTKKSAKTITNKNTNKITKTTKPLVIQSQVKGSQEQPNVIYIMPWQGIENPISIENNQRKISLPTFKPVNPKTFKAQVALFAAKHPANKKAQKQ